MPEWWTDKLRNGETNHMRSPFKKLSKKQVSLPKIKGQSCLLVQLWLDWSDVDLTLKMLLNTEQSLLLHTCVLRLWCLCNQLYKSALKWPAKERSPNKQQAPLLLIFQLQQFPPKDSLRFQDRLIRIWSVEMREVRTWPSEQQSLTTAVNNHPRSLLSQCSFNCENKESVGE